MHFGGTDRRDFEMQQRRRRTDPPTEETLLTSKKKTEKLSGESLIPPDEGEGQREDDLNACKRGKRLMGPRRRPRTGKTGFDFFFFFLDSLWTFRRPTLISVCLECIFPLRPSL